MSALGLIGEALCLVWAVPAALLVLGVLIGAVMERHTIGLGEQLLACLGWPYMLWVLSTTSVD